MDRKELIAICVRLAAGAALSYLSLRYMVKFLDPHRDSREENAKKVARLFAQLGIPQTVQLNEHEMVIATQFVGGEDIGVAWEQIGGCEGLINELKDRVILPLRIASEYSNPLLCPPKGVLLYGPPGCGKTLLAKAVAKASDCRFLNLQVSNLTDKWYGESQKLAAAVFSVAQKFQPTIIFIDEIDSFLRGRQSHDHEATAMMKAQFMTLWDGLSSTNDQIIVMGATNRPKDVDAAIRRRLPARFEVPMPNTNQRENILRVVLRKENLANDVDLAVIAKVAEGLSGSDLKEVCRMAVLSRAKTTLADCGSLKEMQPLEADDLMNAVYKYSQSARLMIEHGLD